MVIPIEDAVLPRRIKQRLIDFEIFSFPPSMEWLSAVCALDGLPIAEATLFIQDNEEEFHKRGIPKIYSFNLNGRDISLEPGIVNIVGPPFSGKTYFCHYASALVLDEPGSCVMYLDCDGGFSPSLLSTCFKVLSKSVEISYFRVHSWMELLCIVASASVRGSVYSLVVVDSMASIFRHELLNEGRFRKEKILATLIRNLISLDCVVLLVNQTTTHFSDGDDDAYRGRSDEGRLKPCLGRVYEKVLRDCSRVTKMMRMLR
jgi:hypothetical protein